MNGARLIWKPSISRSKGPKWGTPLCLRKTMQTRLQVTCNFPCSDVQMESSMNLGCIRMAISTPSHQSVVIGRQLFDWHWHGIELRAA